MMMCVLKKQKNKRCIVFTDYGMCRLCIAILKIHVKYDYANELNL